MKKLFLAFIATGMLFFAACEYETIQPIVVEINTPVSFATDVYPLFSSCATCHSGSKIFDASTLEKAYTSLKNNNLVSTSPHSGDLMDMINAKHQGTASYTAEQKAKIQKWINDGAENN